MKSTAYAISPATRSAPPCWGSAVAKPLDTAKALAHFMNVPVAIAPTIASTDAPCSALSVIYTDEGEFDSYLMLPRNPNMVIVDTQIVAGAPAACWPPGLAMRWLPGSKPAPAPVAAPPPWRAGSAPGGAGAGRAMLQHLTRRG